MSPFLIGADLQPDELRNVLQVKSNRKKSHIVVNKENYDQVMAMVTNENGGSLGASFAGVGAHAAFNTAQEKQNEYEKSNISLDDQLKEINRKESRNIWALRKQNNT